MEEGIVISVNDEHPSKAESPKEVTEEGIEIYLSETQYSKALVFIVLIPESILTMSMN